MGDGRCYAVFALANCGIKLMGHRSAADESGRAGIILDCSWEPVGIGVSSWLGYEEASPLPSVAILGSSLGCGVFGDRFTMSLFITGLASPGPVVDVG